MINVFIGYDKMEIVAFHALCHSIVSKSSVPVSITALSRAQLTRRPRDRLASTDFADTRFLVPWLSGYKGWSIFMDCDQLMLSDISELWDLRDDRYAVMVRKRDHVPKNTIKFLGKAQSAYKRKNWSSLMLFNNEKCLNLSKDYVESANGLDLHQFLWIDDSLIGDLPDCYNVLVGIDKNDRPKHIHYTDGGPYFDEYKNCDYSIDWFDVFNEMVSCG